MPKGGCQQTLRLVSHHLSECDACRSLCARWQKMEDLLIESKRWLDELTCHSAIDRSQLLTQRARPLTANRVRLLRPLWAAAAVLLLAIAGASALFLKGREFKGRDNLATPMTPMAAAASSQTVQELAEVLCRHEAPSPELPYAPAAFTHESFFTTSLQQYLEPEDTIKTIAELTANLTRREET